MEQLSECAKKGKNISFPSLMAPYTPTKNAATRNGAKLKSSATCRKAHLTSLGTQSPREMPKFGPVCQMWQFTAKTKLDLGISVYQDRLSQKYVQQNLHKWHDSLSCTDFLKTSKLLSFDSMKIIPYVAHSLSDTTWHAFSGTV